MEDLHGHQASAGASESVDSAAPTESCSASLGPKPPKKYKKKALPDSFMTSDDSFKECVELIDMRVRQEEMDNL